MAILVASLFGTIAGLSPVDNDEAKSKKVWELTDSCGNVVKSGDVDTDGTPSTSYIVDGTITWGDVELGGVVSSRLITNVVIDTNAGDPPSVKISGEAVGSATEMTGLTPVAINITPTDDNCAQALGSMPATEGTCYLLKCSANFSCEAVFVPGSNGAKAKYGIKNPRVVVTAEYQSSDGTPPTPPTETDTLRITKPVSKAQNNTTQADVFTLEYTEYLG